LKKERRLKKGRRRDGLRRTDFAAEPVLKGHGFSRAV
jgi:hypothetical protein